MLDRLINIGSDRRRQTSNKDTKPSKRIKMSDVVNYSLLVNFFLVLSVNLCKCAENNTLQPAAEEQDTPTKKCYGKFGCYSLEHPWNSYSRPVGVFPQSPEYINPKYCLYTRRNPTICDPLFLDDPQTLFRSNYVPSGQVYFAAHGFVENGNRPWLKDLTKELLKRSNANVIIIDWSGGSEPPYTQAVANIRLVGVMTAHLIHMMSEQVVGLRPERIHIIGHSLGAHLASYVGTTLRRSFNLRLGRITGLDPAEPHFSKTDNLVRLDPSDAIFVDNIHTDANLFVMGGLGMKDPTGHVDFYPNGGRDQPGCEPGLMKYVSEKGSFFKGVTKMIGCNHVRSYQYFIETINSPNKFLAVECPSWELFQNGSCFQCNYNPVYKNGSQCASLGFHSINAFSNKLILQKHKKNADLMLLQPPKRRFISMYLLTGASSPFYRSQYRVTWKMSESSHEVGRFKLKIVGSDGSTDFLTLGSGVQYFDPGSEHRVVVGGANVGHLESAHLEWSYETTLFNPFSWRLHETSISISSIQIDSLETGESLVMCTPENTTLVAGNPKKLTMCRT